MKDKPFSPLLAPNKEIDLYDLQYPLLGSFKLDGCRLLAKEGKLLTRSLKQMPNKQLNEKFNKIAVMASCTDIIYDGEVYAPGIPFQFIVSCFMTHDYTDKKAIKKRDELCEEHDFHMSREEVFKKLKYYCFDGVRHENYSQPFSGRLDNAKSIDHFSDIAVYVDHVLLNGPLEVEEYFQLALSNGEEGLILRNPDGVYKFGRASIKQNIIFKYKPFVTTDAVIKGFVQSTEVNKDAEKTTNELGRSRTSKRKEDRHLVEKAQSFIVDFNGQDLKVPISMTDKMKKYIWNNQDEYIGKWIEYKYMEIGMKKDGLPRIPKFVRMRDDK